MKKYWTQKEEELFKKAWNSTAYSREDIIRVFNRSFMSLDKKARRLGLSSRTEIEGRARIEAIERALEEDHII